MHLDLNKVHEQYLNNKDFELKEGDPVKRACLKIEGNELDLILL